jgi:hypothetical protein
LNQILKRQHYLRLLSLIIGKAGYCALRNQTDNIIYFLLFTSFDYPFGIFSLVDKTALYIIEVIIQYYIKVIWGETIKYSSKIAKINKVKTIYIERELTELQNKKQASNREEIENRIYLLENELKKFYEEKMQW